MGIGSCLVPFLELQKEDSEITLTDKSLPLVCLFEKLRSKSCDEISELSHKGDAWIENKKERELISCEYADKLKFI